MMTRYSLPIPDGYPRQLAYGWLILGLVAIGVSAMFAVLLVLLRTPYISALFPRLDLFPTALVLHVDFAILIWFLSLAGVLWSLLGDRQLQRTGWFALALAITGAILLLAAAFAGEGWVMLSNYLPVLDGPVFLAGLGLFASGCVLMVLRTLVCPYKGKHSEGSVLRLGAYCAAVVVLITLLVTVLTYHVLPPDLHGLAFFEQLFWGGGHVLQFTYALLMLVTWLILSSDAGVRISLRPALMSGLFILGLLPALFAPLLLVISDVGSEHYRLMFTRLMAYGSWPVEAGVGLILLYGLIRARRNHVAVTVSGIVLLFSILLFGAGLLAGSLIRSDNVMVTAHYHGTVGAVTLAFMGLTYHLLDRLGFSGVPSRVARLQAFTYGTGMLSLIIGLAWSGLHGVQRKTAGAQQLLDSVQEYAGMLLMGAGGLVALLATWLFLVLALRALWPARQLLTQPGATE